MQSVRVVVRTLIAVCLAALGPALAVPAVQAHAAQTTSESRGTSAASSHSLTISIDSVSPRYARPTQKVTVSGTLSNHTGSPISGLVVQVSTSPTGISTRSGFDSFIAGGNDAIASETIPVTDNLARPLGSGATTRWSVSFPLQAQNYFYNGFGAYPIVVQATSPSSSHQASDRTVVPYWPGAGSATRLQVAWLWPIIDSPQQGACSQTLTTNNLATEIAARGRLSTLLDEGLTWTAQDHLTWAIDPALLSDVSVMTHPYGYGGNSLCTGRAPKKPTADPAAAPWLTKLQAATAGQSAFLTPYADADAAALSHAGLDDNLTSAYRTGESVAGRILPNTFGAAAVVSSGVGALPAAWPADGTVDSGVLTSLAKDGGVNAVVLQSGSLPSSADHGYDDALGLTKNSLGTKMPALLADRGVTSILGSATANSSRATRFAAEQNFLAVTAMMVAEGPNEGRSLVVAPPQRWDPSESEATTLLGWTHSVPWLRPVGISKLATESRSLTPQRLPARQVSHAELGGFYLSQVSELNDDLSLFEDILYKPAPSVVTALDSALLATESTAWRGGGAPGGWLTLGKTESYINDNEKKIRLIAGKKLLLAGTSGTTPISVQNGSPFNVIVKLNVWTPPGSQLSIGSSSSVLTIEPHKTATTRIHLTSTAIVTTMMQLQLVTTHEAPLSWTGSAAEMSVQVTRYGRTLLALIAGALGVLVLTSAGRWYRRRRAGGRDSGSTDRVTAGGTG
jgi:hypothetical protein